MNDISEQYTYLDLQTFQMPLSSVDCTVVLSALSRLNLYVEDAQHKTDISNAMEINVSEDLFTYVISIVEKTNMSGFISYALTKRVGSDPSYLYSCVAFAFSHAIGDYTFDEIDTWIREEFPDYDGGVPPTGMSRVVSHCWNSDYLYYNHDMDIPEDFEWDARRTLGIFNNQDHTAHMVNIEERLPNGLFWVCDFSADTAVAHYVLPQEDLIGFYMNTSIDTTYAEEVLSALREARL